jgi:hypothetical protein
MAYTPDFSGLSKYTDQLSQKLVREAVLAGTTFKYITVIPDVANTVALNISTSLLVAQAGGNCGLINATGSVTLSQRSLTVCPIKVEEAICEDQFKLYYTGLLMKAGSYTEELSPKMFAEIYTADKVDKLGALIEDLYWKGAVSATFSTDPNMALCNGILSVLLETSATASTVSGNKIAGSASSYTGILTVANAVLVVDNMIQQMNNSIPDILAMPDLTLFMSYGNYNTLLKALRNQNFFHNEIGQTSHEWSFMYPGEQVRIVATRGLNATGGYTGYGMLLTYATNLAYGTDIESDYSNFRIWYEMLYDQMNFRSKFKVGANCFYPQYIVLYS